MGKHEKKVTLRAKIALAAIPVAGALAIPIIVKPGDTLSGIAAEHGTSLSAIERANPQIANPDLIYAGQTVEIPGMLGAHDATTTFTRQHSRESGCAGIARFLDANDLTRVAAAGVAGDVFGESACDPESVGSGGFGLIGWTGNTIGLPDGYDGPTGDRTADLAVQERGIIGYINALGGPSGLNSQGDVVSAGEYFSQHFEKPAVTNSDTRPSVAASILAQLG